MVIVLSVLLLEDMREKAQSICEVISECGDGFDIKTVVSVQEAKEYLSSNSYDLFLVDINVPVRYPEEPVRDAGIDLVKEIYLVRDSVPAHIIGITAYEEIYVNACLEFGDMMFSVIKYEASSLEWKDKLSKHVTYIKMSQSVKRDQLSEEYNYDIGVICAVESEFKQLLGINEYNWVRDDSFPDCTGYYIGKISVNNKPDITVVAGMQSQMGIAPSASLVQKMVHYYKPRYLCMVGIAAGVDRSATNFGDIILADFSYDYQSGKLTERAGEKVFEPDPRQIPIEPDVKAKFQNAKIDQTLFSKIMGDWNGKEYDTVLKLHIGGLASGAAVLSDSESVQGISQYQRKLLGIDMETYGVYYSALNGLSPKPKYFSIKSISDYADNEKSDDHQPYAAFTSSKFLYYFAKQYLFKK